MSFLVLIAVPLCAEGLSRGGWHRELSPKVAQVVWVLCQIQLLLPAVFCNCWRLVFGAGIKSLALRKAYKCQFLRGHLAHGGAWRGHHLGLYRMLPK